MRTTYTVKVEVQGMLNSWEPREFHLGLDLAPPRQMYRQAKRILRQAGYEIRNLTIAGELHDPTEPSVPVE